MINRIVSHLKQLDYPVSATSFAFFRILFALYSLGAIFQLYHLFPLYFDQVPGISRSLFPADLILFAWTVTNILILAGLGTRYVAAANYILVVIMVTFFNNNRLSSFNDDLLRIGSFFLIFLPVSKTWSIDAMIRRITQRDNQRQTSYLYYLLCILLSLGLLYFGSGISKIFSPIWQKGIGLWAPCAIPYFRWNQLPFFADTQWLVYTLNYLVIAFELLFIYLLFRKKFHVIIVVAGIGFHAGIALLFPFTYISLGPIIFYSLFVPERFWIWLRNRIEIQEKQQVWFDPTSYKQSIAIRVTQSFDLGQKFVFIETTGPLRYNGLENWEALILIWRRIPFLYPTSLLIRARSVKALFEYIYESWLPGSYTIPQDQTWKNRFYRSIFFTFTLFLCGIQVFFIAYHSWSALKKRPKANKAQLMQRVDKPHFSTKPSNIARTFFGINSRGVFMDHSLTGTKTVFALTCVEPSGKETWLPIFDSIGYCGSMNRNLLWNKVSFSYLVSDTLHPDTSGLKKISWIWARKNHVSLDNLRLSVYRKIYTFPDEYEKGYLEKMIAIPWEKTAQIHWKDRVFHYTPLPADSLR